MIKFHTFYNTIIIADVDNTRLYLMSLAHDENMYDECLQNIEFQDEIRGFIVSNTNYIYVAENTKIHTLFYEEETQTLKRIDTYEHQQYIDDIYFTRDNNYIAILSHDLEYRYQVSFLTDNILERKSFIFTGSWNFLTSDSFHYLLVCSTYGHVKSFTQNLRNELTVFTAPIVHVSNYREISAILRYNGSITIKRTNNQCDRTLNINSAKKIFLLNYSYIAVVTNNKIIIINIGTTQIVDTIHINDVTAISPYPDNVRELYIVIDDTDIIMMTWDESTPITTTTTTTIRRERRESMKNQRIHKIGVELEGGWQTKPDLSSGAWHIDNSVSGHLGRYTGEVVSTPIEFGDREELYAWIERYYPLEVNESCGLHVHISFLSNCDYYSYVNEKFYNAYKKFLYQMSDSDSDLLQRLKYDNSYCRDQFRPLSQLTVDTKVCERYSIVNYCRRLRGTIEFRGFNMPGKSSIAIERIEKLLILINNFKYNKRIFSFKWVKEDENDEQNASNIRLF